MISTALPEQNFIKYIAALTYPLDNRTIALYNEHMFAKSNKKHMIKNSFIFTSIQKVLVFFCLRPNSKFHEREVARQIGISPSSAYEALKYLEKEGILVSERIGKMVFYQLDESRPLARQYKVMAIVFALEPLALKLSKVADKVILFGSSARGDYLQDSDVDLFIITSHQEKVHDILFNFQKGFMKEIKPVIMSLAEWMDYEKKDPIFYNEVTKGLVLYEKYES